MTTPKLAPVARVEDGPITTGIMPPTLGAALLRAQLKFPPIPKAHKVTVKTSSGASYSYNYADLSDILAGIRPPLASEGILLTYGSRVDERICVVSCILAHPASGECYGAELPMVVPDSDKEAGGRLTYFRRYLTTIVTGIVAEDDDDATVSGEVRRQSAPRRSEGGRSEGSGGSRAGNGQSSAAKAKFWKALREEFATENPWKSHGARRMLQLVFSTTDAPTIKAMSDEVFVAALNHPETGWKASLEKVRAEESEREPGEEGEE